MGMVPRIVPSQPWALALAPLCNTRQWFSKRGPKASGQGTAWNILEKQNLGVSRGSADPEIPGLPAAWQACSSSHTPSEV